MIGPMAAHFTRVSPRELRLGHVIQASVAEARHVVSWSQRELADRARVSQSTVSRIERGRAWAISVHHVLRVCDALGIEVDLLLQPPLVRGARHQADAVHARVAGHAGRRLRRAGWLVADEVEVGSGRTRGYLDQLAFREHDGVAVVEEFKTEIHDVGELLRTLGWYEREAWHACRRLGWHPRLIVLILVVLDTAAAHETLVANRQLFDPAFPARSTAVAAWLDDAASPPPGGRAIVAIDPACHGRRWLYPTRLERPRRQPRYLDYRDAARPRTTRTTARANLRR